MREDINKVLENVGKGFIGKKDVLEKLLAGLLADGHVLLEDVPGTGKRKSGFWKPTGKRILSWSLTPS